VPQPFTYIRVALVTLLLAACTEASEPEVPAECTEQTPGELFAQRIEPLFSQDRPQSCNQCHLSGIELGSFARATPCETMACLTEQGMVNLDAPAESKILDWIQRAHPDSELITEQVIREEYDGFLAWIEYSAACHASACEGVTCSAEADPFCDTEPAVGPYDASQDPGGCTDKALEQLFRDTIYKDRGRCYPCHFEQHEMAAPTAPKWISQEGSCDQASLVTMRTVIERGHVNVADPAQSLLLLKPLGPEFGGVEHGGASKFHGVEDEGYANFFYWLKRYSDCQKQP
jgi:hypothetical protein